MLEAVCDAIDRRVRAGPANSAGSTRGVSLCTKKQMACLFPTLRTAKSAANSDWLPHMFPVPFRGGTQLQAANNVLQPHETGATGFIFSPSNSGIVLNVHLVGPCTRSENESSAGS